MNHSSSMVSPVAEQRMLLNLGCGPEVQSSRWIDIDGSWNLRVQSSWWGRMIFPFVARHSEYMWPTHIRWMDITRGLPFADSSVDAVYASHVLEHLYRSDALQLLTECRRILKPRGVIRLVLPDLKTMAASYLQDARSDAAVYFNQQLLMREANGPTGSFGRLKMLLADHHTHKFMYDVPLLQQDLMEAGFRDVSEHTYLDSRIPEINEVEQPGRVLYGAGIIVEALN